MRAEIISIGTELLLGEITDTNTPFLARQLAMLGIDLYFASTAGDNIERLSGALRQAWKRSEIILTTGGLGPTQDDITRESISSLLGEEPEVDTALKENLVGYFTKSGMGFPESNLKQASLIPSAKSIPNPKGTAPGWWVEKDGRIIIAMPGPPREMEFMWQNEVFPRLQKKAGAVILSKTLKTIGLSEAKVDESVAHLMSSSNPTIATYAKSDGILLRITAKAAQSEDAERMIAGLEKDVRKVLGDYIWGVDDEKPEDAASQLLIAKGLTLAVCDSFTDSLLAYTLASATNSQRYFKGGFTANTNDSKIALGIYPSLTTERASDTSAIEMAQLARSRLNADIGIGIDGYTKTKDRVTIGTGFIAIVGEQFGQHTSPVQSGRTTYIKRRAAYVALFELRKLLA